jgi:hypothetical protein
MTTHGQTGVCECPTGQGVGEVITLLPAKAVSIGNQPETPHGLAAIALTAFIGIAEGAKNSIAPINAVLTILRSFMCRPRGQILSLVIHVDSASTLRQCRLGQNPGKRALFAKLLLISHTDTTNAHIESRGTNGFFCRFDAEISVVKTDFLCCT